MNTVQMLTFAVFLAAGVFYVSAESFAVPADETEKIENLIRAVETSSFIFIRNGIEYSSKKAASHMRMKLSRAGNRIRTADQFIRYIATKSSITGKPYLVRLKDGRIVLLSEWLGSILQTM
ncbi:MAG: DUF5329 domain-containing protein [Spirochaetia bacterium]|nr:DUF5329 domain-containing protein [Spirochaetia bacterium]